MPVREDVRTVGLLRAALGTFRDLLRAHEAPINRLNVYPVPDGDTGTNMRRTLDAVVEEMSAAPDELAATCDAISHGALMGARGNSGVIVSQILRGLAATLRQRAELTGEVFATALAAASDAAYGAVLTPTEGTILTVLRESAAGAASAARDGEPLPAVVRAARDAGRDALARTPDLLPVLRAAGVVDAGGAGLLLLLEAALHVVAGEDLPVPPPADSPADATAPAAEVASAEVPADGSGRYEVMFLCHLDDARIDDLKARWGEIGNSIVVVGGGGTWNCHVHTDDVGAAIEASLDVDGKPFRIRVTDLRDEVAAEHARREAVLGPAPELPGVTCAVVAVSSGPGLDAMFRELGVQVVVTGGQTLNPSTAELLGAVERANAASVVVLPNNKNIVPVAEQVDGLSAKEVRVVPTRSMPEGVAALIAYDPAADASSNAVAMRHAAEAIATGEVTRAVRAADSAAGPIAEGDWIGIASGRGIVAVAGTAIAAARTLLETLVTGDTELTTAITGADASPAETAVLEAWFGERFPGVDLEVHVGGQPLYPYLFGVE